MALAALLFAPAAGVRGDPLPPLPGPAPQGRPQGFSARIENQRCEACHEDIAAEWRASLHRQAFTDRVFQRSYALEPLPFCRGCHAPEADPAHHPGADAQAVGVGCVTCHLVAGEVVSARGRDARGGAHAVRGDARLPHGAGQHAGLVAQDRSVRLSWGRSSRTTIWTDLVPPLRLTNRPILERRPRASRGSAGGYEWSASVKIGKPVRILMSALLAGGAAGAVGGGLYSRIEVLSAAAAMVALVPAWFLWGGVVDHLDLSLRRRTRDAVWLLTREGQAWLSSTEGTAWSNRHDKTKRRIT
ncbi:multiheme c-type cytochrome [Sorangium sp. So ce128]|uniref:multiheme c-type cytochrome n=1 Tax=Sorangium sp. So ce128 TaxID=3133281 RepID=UPI003F631967